MIHAIEVVNYIGDTLRLELGRPDLSGLIVQSIDGLGPPTASINTTEIATGDGAVYNSARTTSRNIVLTLAFMFAPQIEDARQKTYRYFPTKKPLVFRVITDNRVSEAFGYVESNTPIIFDQNTTTQISIICPDPYFYATRNMTTIFSGIEPMFEFPFSNESLDEPLLIMSEYKMATNASIFYPGDADAGMIITLHATGTVYGITIHNEETRERMRINASMVASDDIIISTVRGDKYVRRLRGGAYTNILNNVDRNSDWIQLHHGTNRIAYQADTGVDKLEFKLECRIAYEGV